MPHAERAGVAARQVLLAGHAEVVVQRDVDAAALVNAALAELLVAGASVDRAGAVIGVEAA
jgi:hypothetical protein